MSPLNIDLELGDLFSELGLGDIDIGLDSSSGNGTNIFEQNKTNKILTSIIEQFSAGKIFLLIHVQSHTM